MKTEVVSEERLHVLGFGRGLHLIRDLQQFADIGVG